MSQSEPLCSDHRALVVITARPPAGGAALCHPLPARQLAWRNPAGQLDNGISTLCLIGIALGCVGAFWATICYQAENKHFRLDANPQAPAALAVRNIVSAPRSVQKGDVPRSGLLSPAAPVGTVLATAPLGWNDLSLMLRAGLSDEEIIADAANKQLTVAIGPEQERVLRGMGAGNRLIGYLRGQRVYGAPPPFADRPTNAPARPNVAPQASYVPAATPWPTFDYAARDREIARLKKRIDDLDEQVRITRTHPNDYHNQWMYRADGTRTFLTNDDAYLKSLEEQRDNLRREKWQLEGR